MTMVGPGYLHKRITNPSEGGVGGYASFASAADIFRWSPGAPAMVLRWGVIATTTVNDGSNGLKLTCDLRPTAGSDTGRLKGATYTVASQGGYNAAASPAFYIDYGGTGTTLGLGGGSITLTASATQIVAGKGVYHNVNPQAPTGSTLASGVITALGGYYPSPDTAFVPPGGIPTQFMVYPGQEVVIAVQATAPGAGAGVIFLEVIEQAFQGDYNNYGDVLSGVPSSISPTPSNATFNLARVLA